MPRNSQNHSILNQPPDFHFKITAAFSDYAMLYSMTDTDFDSSLFNIKLSSQQRAFLNSVLPKGYSLQPGPIVANNMKNILPRKINSIGKEESGIQKDQVENKRRKNKSYQQIQLQEKPNSLAKKDEISKKAAIVKKLKKHDSSWPFRSPVDPKALLIPNYTKIVLTPIDLQTIEERIKGDKYEHASQIERDINQMLLNSYKFNSKDSEYFQATSKLQQYYQSLLNQSEYTGIKKQLPDRQKKKEDNQNHEGQKGGQMSEFQKDLLGLLKRANQLSGQRQVRQKPIYVSSKQEGNISVKQKRELALEIKSLDESHLSRIFEIIRHSAKDGQQYKIGEKTETISIDMEKLDNRTVRELQNYVRLQKNSVIHDRQQSMIDSHENQYSIY